jgi:ArsR family transcriptional regulator, arsenate/arsenite/antimonite-responsive transcriptional repressor / arsenate reductase (thioredoxin)
MTVGTAPAAPKLFRLLAEPLRWRLLVELAKSDRRVGELTSLLGKPQNLLSYHLSELRSAGLVTARRSSADGRDTYYRAELLRCGELLGEAGLAIHPGLRPLPPQATADASSCKRRAPLVLFLCTGNSARSQIAEALLEHRSGQAVRARSAGSHPKPLHPYAVGVMAERGIDISGHRTKHLRCFARARFGRVITLCDKVKEICPEFPGAPMTAHWSMADPATEGDTEDERYAAFQRTAADLDNRIGLLIIELSATTGITAASG